jgi:hypothetical protein
MHFITHVYNIDISGILTYINRYFSLFQKFKFRFIRFSLILISAEICSIDFRHLVASHGVLSRSTLKLS